MDKWGYDWEAVDVTTEDGYILTTFHILGKTGEPRPQSHKASVLVQHGAYMEGSMFFPFVEMGEGKSYLLDLVDEGYDIWIGNNRGTNYSQGHETLSAVDDTEYWEFSWAEMGLYDDVANIKMIKEQAEVDKIFYMGYSQGTTQMFYSLAHLDETFHKNNLYKAIMLAPCVSIRSTEEQIEFMEATTFTYQ